MLSVLKNTLKFFRLHTLAEAINFSLPKKINGRNFSIPLIAGVGFGNFQLENCWLADILARIGFAEPDVFIDVGANVGQTLLVLRSRFNNRYYGFEPNPACVNYLKILIQKNRITDATVIPAGLSSETALVPFFQKSNRDASATIMPDLRPGAYQKEECAWAPVFCFDKLNIIGYQEKIAAIKIDVEGAELDVLRGMVETITRHQPIVFCEVLDSTHHSVLRQSQQRATALCELLESLHYVIYRIAHAGDCITLEKISHIALKQWTPRSSQENDYLFVSSHIDVKEWNLMARNSGVHA